MKRVPGLRIIWVLLLGVLVCGFFTDGADRPVQGQQLKGAAAQEFLAREGILDQFALEPATVPLQGRNFLEPAPLAASDGAASDKFGFSVAASGYTVVVGAYWANSAQGAAYVFVRDGDGWSEQQKLVANDGAAGDGFGNSVAVDGKKVVVGASYADIGGNADQGAAYVFVRDGGAWIEQKKLIANDGASFDKFGFSVAVDGNTVAVGAVWADDASNLDQGAAYIFTRSGDSWSQQQKLVSNGNATVNRSGYAVAWSENTSVAGGYAADGDGPAGRGVAYISEHGPVPWPSFVPNADADGAAGDDFGVSVALSEDTVIVGAIGADVNSNTSQGAAYVFTRSGSTWSLQQKLFDADGAPSDIFGFSVAVSGETAVVSAPLADIEGTSNQGAAYIFTRSGSSWSQQQKLAAADGAMSDWFGSSVAVDGDTVVVGAHLADIGINADQGAAYVFTREASIWSQHQKLIYDDNASSNGFGYAVALSGDMAVTGAYLADGGGPVDRGIVYISERAPVPWPLSAHKVASDGATDDTFGYSVALSGDTAVAGALGADVDGIIDQGAAYVFTRDGPSWVQQQKLVANDGAAFDAFGYSVAVDGNTAVIGAVLADVNGTIDQGAAYVFTRDGPSWVQQQKLVANDGAASDEFGYSVAVDGNMTVIGAVVADVNGTIDQGAAYVFTRNGNIWTQQQKLVAGDGAKTDLFGISVDVEDSTVLIGAVLADIYSSLDRGAAYVFTRNDNVWTQQQKLVAGDGAIADFFGSAVALSENTAVIGAPLADVNGPFDQGAAYIFTRSGGAWSDQQKLAAPDGRGLALFGNSVSLAGNKLLLGANEADIGGFGQGSAYVFARSGEAWHLEQKLLAADGAGGDEFGYSVALSGNTAVVGAFMADIGGSMDRGKVYFFQRQTPIFKIYLPEIMQ